MVQALQPEVLACIVKKHTLSFIIVFPIRRSMPAFRSAVIFVFLFLSFQSHSHSGVTSAEGCHSNENTSGYHCHNQNAKRNRYPYTITQKVTSRPQKGKIQTRQIASMDSKPIQAEKSRPSLKDDTDSGGKKLAGIENKSLPQSEKKGLSKDFQPKKKSETRGLASIGRNSNPKNPQQPKTSLQSAVSYKLFEEKVDDTPLKTQIIQHLGIQGIPSKDHLRNELMKRYRLLKTRKGFKQRPFPTGIYIYVYETKKHKGSGLWIAMLGWNMTDADQTKDPSVQFNESLLSKLSNPVNTRNQSSSKAGEDNKSALVQDQKFSSSSQEKSKESLSQSPVKALKGVPQIWKKMKLNNVQAVQFKGVSKTQNDRKISSKVVEKKLSNKERVFTQPSKKAPNFQSKKSPQPKIERAGASLSKPLAQARKAVSRVQNTAKQKLKAIDLKDKPAEKNSNISK